MFNHRNLHWVGSDPCFCYAPPWWNGQVLVWAVYFLHPTGQRYLYSSAQSTLEKKNRFWGIYKSLYLKVLQTHKTRCIIFIADICFLYVIPSNKIWQIKKNITMIQILLRHNTCSMHTTLLTDTILHDSSINGKWDKVP